MFVEMAYGEDWRKHRAAFMKFMEPAVVLGYMDVQRHEVHKLLNALLGTPDDFTQLIRT